MVGKLMCFVPRLNLYQFTLIMIMRKLNLHWYFGSVRSIFSGQEDIHLAVKKWHAQTLLNMRSSNLFKLLSLFLWIPFGTQSKVNNTFGNCTSHGWVKSWPLLDGIDIRELSIWSIFLSQLAVKVLRSEKTEEKRKIYPEIQERSVCVCTRKSSWGQDQNVSKGQIGQ